MLHYGQSLHPLLDSLPEVFYQPEDLYVSRQWGIRTEEWMGYRRTASETSVLAELACNWVNQREVDKGKKMLSALSPVPNPQSPIPTLAMVDGSLIYWFLEQLPGGSTRSHSASNFRSLGCSARGWNSHNGLLECFSQQ
jgi:hypothetical protein